MKDRSFHEILAEKLLGKLPEPPAEPSLIDFEALIFEQAVPQFFIPTPPANKSSLHKYPQSKRPQKVDPATNPVKARESKVMPIPAAEKFILKTALSAEEKSKWNLFEKTIGSNLGDQTTAPAVRSSFRKFLKRVHPDLSQQKTTANFATFVKIKDEFLAVLKKHS